MKPIIIGRTPTGLPSASAGDIRIHSRYDPVREAGRFLDSQEVSAGFGGVIILIGAGLGYLDAALRKQAPDCRIIAIHLDSELYGARINTGDDGGAIARWHPGSPEDIGRFLHDKLSEFEIPGLKVIEWPASVSARPSVSDLARESTASLIRLYSGNISATAAFGRHWIRNLLRNFIGLDHVVEVTSVEAPVVIAASGPSLEEALPSLSRYRSRYRLWSLPSSLPALGSAGVEPDMILSTDAGFWARLHTRYFPPHIPVAMPLSSVPTAGNPVIPILMDIPGEKELLADRSWSGLGLSEAGTVAATALEAWKVLGRGPLALVGLDLAWTDLRAHARPHGFDGWLESRRNRTCPPLTSAWERALAQAPYRDGPRRWGPSLQTYADWFDTIGRRGSIIRFRAEESSAAVSPLSRLRQAGSEWFDHLPQAPSSDSTPAIIRTGDKERRKEAVRRLLERWTDLIESRTPDEETARLGYTLDPAGVLDAGRLSGEERRARMNRHFDEVAGILRGLSRGNE